MFDIPNHSGDFMEKSIWKLKAGQKCIITEYNSDLSPSYQTRLKDLGFHPGEEVQCVASPSLGAPKLYKINNAIFALDHQVAQGVYCE